MVAVPRTILVSACLLGLKTRYDGECRKNAAVIEYLQNNGWTPIPICPEQLGGLPTPRPEVVFRAGDGTSLTPGVGQLVNNRSEDVGFAFIRGAQQATAIAQICGCTTALLKERSPSCGVNSIYRNGTLVKGAGVTTAHLMKAGLKIFSEENLIVKHLKNKEGE